GKPIHKKKHRKEMRRKFNKLKEDNIEIKFEKDVQKTKKLIEIYLEFFARSSNQEKQKFIQSKASQYFNEILDIEVIKFSTMEFNKEIISILIYFENNDNWVMNKDGRKVFYLYNMASNTDFYHYSPGLIHVNSMIMDVIENRYDEFNFLRGSERYKFEIGANA